MTKRDQLKILREASDWVAAECLASIRMGKVPPQWDGHELRCWLADCHAKSAAATIIRRYPHRKRALDYNNHRCVEDL